MLSVFLRKLRIHALRGQHSAKLFSSYLPADKQITLGDPGLLADRLISDKRDKQYKYGIVAHYADKKSVWFSWLSEHCERSICIDVAADPLRVIEQISQCEMILSSSLHGLVVADSLRVANQWIMFGDTPRAKECWKYHDYYSVFSQMNMPMPWIITKQDFQEIKILEHSLSSYARPGIDNIKQDLYDSFPFL